MMISPFQVGRSWRQRQCASDPSFLSGEMNELEDFSESSSVDVVDHLNACMTLKLQTKIGKGMKKSKCYLRHQSTVPMTSFFSDGDDDAAGTGDVEDNCSLREVESTHNCLTSNSASSIPTHEQRESHQDSSHVSTRIIRESQDLLPSLLHSVHEREWNTLSSLLEQDPSLSRSQVTMVVQGENSTGLLVHLLCGIRETPVSVIDALVTLHPNALLQAEDRAGRLPIHIAVVKDAFPEMIRYLCNACPQALQCQDQEGNLPLHYAAMHGSTTVLRSLLEAFPQACTQANTRDRFPIHLLCSRCYDTAPVPTKDLETIIQANPDALLQGDRFGRTPLHLAASVQNPQWQILQTLIEHAPNALLYKDKACNIPLQCAKRGRNRMNDIVVSSLAECTTQQRRKRRNALSWKPLTFSRNTKNEANDLYCCYG